MARHDARTGVASRGNGASGPAPQPTSPILEHGMTYRPPARPVALGRARRATAALVAAALALAGAVALVAGPQARPAAAAIGFCPDPDDFPNIGPLPIFTDNNVAVYAG